MNLSKINMALSNQTRLNIMKWLREPELNFPPHQLVPDFSQGVCVKFIQDKCGLSQSTISHYLGMLENTDLVISTRIGKWTYHKRNEETLQNYIEFLKSEI